MVDLSKFVEVTLNEQDDFLKVRETLTRIGVSSRKERILYQSCQKIRHSGDFHNDLQLFVSMPYYCVQVLSR